MAKLNWNDIEQNDTLSSADMADAKGGWFYFNVFNPYMNPYGWGMQNSWISRSTSFDRQHNSFISFLRS